MRHRLGKMSVIWCFTAVLVSAAEPASDDLLIADFEGENYGAWQVEGEAFGQAPAQGTLPNQMPVSGYLGKGLVNSYLGGDGSTGTLTSPRFRLERPYLSFLIGGGAHAGETCLNLLIDGKIVRTAAGPNSQAGGSEQLEWSSWGVGEFLGREAILQVVDRHRGGWGHINVDQIVQSRKPRTASERYRDIEVTQRLLHFPVKSGATKRRLQVRDGQEVWREFEIELADQSPDAWFFLDVSPKQGRRLTLSAKLPEDSPGLEQVVNQDQAPESDQIYREKLRPQLHFTSIRGWLNDPNGLVYSGGEYHLFYQHNPYGVQWGNMHWGHAVSSDLVRWKELGIALYPRQYGDWAFSGSAIVDEQNTSGFGRDGKAPLIAAYTSTGRGECIIYSLDQGRSWQEYEGNPVVKHSGRDPRLLWYGPGKHWVMAVYDEMGSAIEDRYIAFYTSPDLKDWTYQSRIQGYFECPDLFPLALPGGNSTSSERANRSKESESLWVLYAADGKYALGQFDGKSFQVTSGKHQLWYGQFYAAQTFSNEPLGRRVQIGWGNGITFPGMPFNQQMTVPVELTLIKTPEGPRMKAWPVAEFQTLRRGPDLERSMVVGPGEMAFEWEGSDLFDVELDLVPAMAQECGVRVKGLQVKYEPSTQKLSVGSNSPQVRLSEGHLRLRILCDRGSVEVFAQGGEAVISQHHVATDDAPPLVFFAKGGETQAQCRMSELASIWANSERP